MWATLGKIGLGLLGVGGSMAGGRQQGRETEATFQQRQDQLAQGRYQNELAAARLNLDAPQIRADQSMRGDVLANVQPFEWTGGTRMVGNIPVPQSRGGINPSIISDNTRSLGRMMSAGAVGQQGVNDGRAIEAPPSLTPLPQVGRGESLLNILGQIAPFASIIGGGLMNRGGGGSSGIVNSGNINWPRFG